jgi:hypothetical protein
LVRPPRHTPNGSVNEYLCGTMRPQTLPVSMVYWHRGEESASLTASRLIEPAIQVQNMNESSKTRPFL